VKKDQAQYMYQCVQVIQFLGYSAVFQRVDASHHRSRGHEVRLTLLARNPTRPTFRLLEVVFQFSTEHLRVSISTTLLVFHLFFSKDYVYRHLSRTPDDIQAYKGERRETKDSVQMQVIDPRELNDLADFAARGGLGSAVA